MLLILRTISAWSFLPLSSKNVPTQGGIEVIFDRIFSFAGDDDDVLDAGGDALFRHVLNLRLVDDGKHLFRLCLGGRQKSRAKAGGREHRLADFVAATCGAVSSRRVGCGGGIVGHRLSFLHTLICCKL